LISTDAVFFSLEGVVFSSLDVSAASQLMFFSYFSSFSSSLSFVSLLVIVLVFFVTRLFYLIHVGFTHRKSCIERRKQQKKNHLNSNGDHLTPSTDSDCQDPSLTISRRTMVILGSGGHTAEMICLLKNINRHRHLPLIYVRAATDISSEVRIKEMEESASNLPNCRFHSIPRSREVGQSYSSSVLTTIKAILYCFRIIHTYKPELLLCNGPGTCFPVVLVLWFYRILWFSNCRIIFIESFCRVEDLSLCGQLIYPLVDRFIVQWPKLTNKYKLTEFVGRLC